MAAVAINLRASEGCAPQPPLFWDAVWDLASGAADWALAGADEPRNIGGLKGKRALETAVVLCLFTDRYCPPTHPLARYVESGDPRGWWGDGVDVRADIGEAALGSLLWTLERAVVTADTIRWAQQLALESLSALVRSGAAARADAQAYGEPRLNRLDLAVQLYGRDGVKIYDRRFDDVWAQLAANGV